MERDNRAIQIQNSYLLTLPVRLSRRAFESTGTAVTCR
jgi:hypothetical protein